MASWSNCRKILCIRPDNMGDVLMSGPAMKALKESFGAEITLLTSSAGKGIARFMPVVDEVITYDVPWVKGPSSETDSFSAMVALIKEKQFDAAVIFTVFSQNPLPSVMLAYLSQIPFRLSYCRENPYGLLTDWVPDEEPYTFIRHQVQRDLDLVKTIGAAIADSTLILKPQGNVKGVLNKLADLGVDPAVPWVIFHPGVSEVKRQYPNALWIETGKLITQQLKCQVVITGAANEKDLCNNIRQGIGSDAFSVAGEFSLEEFINLIDQAPLTISVNTGTIHICAALQKPVIVLYALTNPQHTPWKTTGKVFPFPVEGNLQSRNEVLKFLQQTYFKEVVAGVTPQDIFLAARTILIDKALEPIPELVSTRTNILSRESVESCI